MEKIDRKLATTHTLHRGEPEGLAKEQGKEVLVAVRGWALAGKRNMQVEERSQEGEQKGNLDQGRMERKG